MYENFMSYNEIVSNEPTNREILEAVNTIAVAGRETSEKVDGLSTKFEGLSETVREVLGAVNDFSTAVEKRFNGVDKRLDNLEVRVVNIETRVTKTEALMVTKDYLDDKLAILRGDVFHVIRKEDSRVTRLIEILYKKTLITNEEIKILEELQPLTAVV